MMSVFLMASSWRYHGTSVAGWLLAFADDLVVFSASFDAIVACRIRHEPRKYETTSTPASVLVDSALLVVPRFATMTDELSPNLLINMQQSKNTLATPRPVTGLYQCRRRRRRTGKYSPQRSKEPSCVQWEATSTCYASTRVTLESDNTLMIGERCSAVCCGEWVGIASYLTARQELYSALLKVKMWQSAPVNLILPSTAYNRVFF